MEEETNGMDATELGTPPVEETTENGDSQEEEIDYRAELEKERKRREKAEYALKERNMADKRRESDPVYVDEDIDARIEARLEAKMNAFRTSQLSDLVEDSIQSLASSEEEKELIRYHYNNSIIQTGSSRSSIVEDMKKAQLLANAAKYQRTSAELEETLKAKKSLGKGGGTNQDKTSFKPDLSKSFTEAEWRFMQERNFTEEMIKKAADAKRTS